MINNSNRVRLRYEDVAEILNCTKDDIPILVAAKLLRPLGKPIHNSTKYFSKNAIALLITEDDWLSKVTNALYLASRVKNDNRRSKIIPFKKEKGAA